MRVVVTCACCASCEVVERANNVKYGLCASVWSSDINKAHRVARKLEVEMTADFVIT